jgi:hypothetical protein
LALALVLATGFGSPPLRAQNEPVLLSQKALEARIQELASTSGEEPTEERGRELANYREALRLTKELESAQAREAEYLRRTEAASSLPDPPAPEVPPLLPNELPPAESEAGPLAELETRLESVKESLGTARAVAQENLEEEGRRNERSTILPDLILKATTEIAAIPAPPVPLASAPEIEQSEYHRQFVQRELLKQERNTLRAEQKFYEVSAAALTAEGLGIAQRLAALSQSADEWQKLIDQRRLESLDEVARRARADAERLTEVPGARAVALETADLIDLHKDLSLRMAEANQRLVELEKTNQRVVNRHANALRRVKLLEDADLPIDASTGQLLRTQRLDLPASGDLRKQLRDVLGESARTQFTRIELSSRMSALMSGIHAPEPADKELDRLRETRQRALSAAITEHRNYLDTL